MDIFAAYIPMDRRQVLASGTDLPLNTSGAALFADISGFTPLTEALALEMGPQRGAEELTVHLNIVYDALIGVLHEYGGSVIGFSGDAITCWLDHDDGIRATACAIRMQEVMSAFGTVSTASGKSISLSIKIAVSTGDARRFIVGDPEIQYIDVLSGLILDNLAEAEHMTEKGEIVLDPITSLHLQQKVKFQSWRINPNTNERYGIVESLLVDVTENPWSPSADLKFKSGQVRPWVLGPVFDRLEAGLGDFLAELRPAVALFLRFRGIDFQGDKDASGKLNDFVKRVQQILQRYEGTLIQLTIGDKGSYLYAAFGAPLAHEDDPVRAATAGLDLQLLVNEFDCITSIQIGITRGRMRTGAYGSTSRRTYGVLGDAVNLSARLMQAAPPGEIIISEKIFQSIENYFSCSKLPEIFVKGKSEPIAIYRLDRRKEKKLLHVRELKYSGPMVGREKELATIGKRFSRIQEGNGQIIGIVAEAGMGKTRLIAEVVKRAEQQNFSIYGGECLSYGTKTSYLVWQNIWRSLFNVDSEWSTQQQITQLESELERINPDLIPRLPLLGTVINLPIPDNELTHNLDSKLRKSSLESLLVECLRAKVKDTPTVIILEDIQWLDPLSHDLLDVIGRAIRKLPVLIITAYRPIHIDHSQELRITSFPYFREISLQEFTPELANQLILIKLEEHIGSPANVQKDLLERITARAQGNPFYIEELVIYFRNQNIDLGDSKAIEKAELPASLHSLILSRMDQLNESNKTTLKVASVIGRSFDQGTLQEVLPGQGSNGKNGRDLSVLCSQDFISRDGELVDQYIFKHIVTHEVAYESLPYERRSSLHNQIGLYIEHLHQDQINQFVGVLAHHFGHSRNNYKKCEYLLKAGELAQNNYANETSINYFQRALPLLKSDEQVDVRMKLGKLFERIGKWKEAAEEYSQALEITMNSGDQLGVAWCQTAFSELYRKQGQYDKAEIWLQLAQAAFEDLENEVGMGQVFHNGGTLAAQQGDFEKAISLYSQSLDIRRSIDDKANIGSLLSNMGIIASYGSDYQAAYNLYLESLEIRREVGDKGAIATSLNNLGNAALALGNYEEAYQRIEEALALQRIVGDQWSIGNVLNNLANVARTRGDYTEACRLYDESLLIYRDLVDKWALAFLLEDIAGLRSLLGEPQIALLLVGAAAGIREQIGSPLPPSAHNQLEKLLEPARSALCVEEQDELWNTGKQMPLDRAITLGLHDICD